MSLVRHFSSFVIRSTSEQEATAPGKYKSEEAEEDDGEEEKKKRIVRVCCTLLNNYNYYWQYSNGVGDDDDDDDDSMMLIVTRSAFVAYLKQAKAVTRRDLSSLFFLRSVERQETTAGGSIAQWNTKKTKAIGERKRWQHAMECYVVFYYNALFASKKVRSIQRRIISVFSIFSSSLLCLSFFFFCFLLLYFFSFDSFGRQYFISLRNYSWNTTLTKHQIIPVTTLV